jgi:type IV pilus assembly protein PilW
VGLRRPRGFNLLELTIALVLGLTLLAAFLAVLHQCRVRFATNESVARLQDAARQALSVLVPDIEHAGFYGFTNVPTTRVAGALPASIGDCGANFTQDLRYAVQGSDNSFQLGSNAPDCAPTAAADGARAGSDTLTVRHASRDAAAPHAGRLQVYSSRLQSAGPLVLFGDGRAPGAIDADHVVRDLEVRSYYIANSSVGERGRPALRVKSLTESGGAAQFRDEEILGGVEDLQVELGVASLASGVLRTFFVAPGSPRAREGSIVAVRLWLRIRSDATEAGYRDDRDFAYANVHFIPTVAETAQRRLIVERTVALRNARPP